MKADSYSRGCEFYALGVLCCALKRFLSLVPMFVLEGHCAVATGDPAAGQVSSCSVNSVVAYLDTT